MLKVGDVILQLWSSTGQKQICAPLPYFRFCDCLYKAVYKQMSFNKESVNISIQSAAQPVIFHGVCVQICVFPLES
jgi:hypothetical protein